jgi:hypothetical protein
MYERVRRSLLVFELSIADEQAVETALLESHHHIG